MQERLCGMWGVSAGLISSLLPWMRGASLRLRLESHLHYIYTADWLVKLEGGLTNLPENDFKKVNRLYMYQHPTIAFCVCVLMIWNGALHLLVNQNIMVRVRIHSYEHCTVCIRSSMYMCILVGWSIGVSNVPTCVYFLLGEWEQAHLVVELESFISWYV